MLHATVYLLKRLLRWQYRGDVCNPHLPVMVPLHLHMSVNQSGNFLLDFVEQEDTEHDQQQDNNSNDNRNRHVVSLRLSGSTLSTVGCTVSCETIPLIGCTFEEHHFKASVGYEIIDAVVHHKLKIFVLFICHHMVTAIGPGVAKFLFLRDTMAV